MVENGADENTSTLPDRTRARKAALQYLYALDLRSGEELEPGDYLDPGELNDELCRFGKQLIEAVQEHREEIDSRIKSQSENWQLDRMSVVDRNLLRLGIGEMCFYGETPRTVVINECVELARRLGSKDSHEFVNAILDRIEQE